MLQQEVWEIPDVNDEHCLQQYTSGKLNEFVIVKACITRQKLNPTCLRFAGELQPHKFIKASLVIYVVTTLQ